MNVADKKTFSQRLRAVILLSGGMDSAVAAALARQKGRRLCGLAFDYGQRHKIELKYARVQARALGFESFQVVRVPLKKIAKGALVDQARVRKSGLAGNRPGTYVSFRNGVFLALAASYAEALSAAEIWGGWCETDAAGYPDCRPSFLKAFEKALQSGTRQARFRIAAPLAGRDKQGIVRLAGKLGVDLKKTWSCYDPHRGKPCGKCDACRLRARGMR
jgi:7-cyano-7-deazaguanine synthase